MATSIVSSKQKWKEFLTRYYKERIQLLAVSDAKMKSLTVNFQDIVRYDVRLSEELVRNPDKVLKDAEDAVPLVDLPVKKKVLAHVRFSNMPQRTRVRDIRSGHINTLVSFDCTIRNISVVNQRIIVGAFECARCGNIVYLPQEGSGKFLEPSYCSCNEEKKGVFRIIFTMSTFEDYQCIRIQESLEDLDGGSEPQTFECNLNNDLVGVLNPGDRVVMTGIVRSVQKIKKDGKTVYFNNYMDVNNYERDEEELDELDITAEDEAMLKALAGQKDILERVAGSIAPMIYGYQEEKRAIALQLFGGIPRNMPDGTRIRGDIHLLFIGDPGIGKSQILESASELAPRGISTTGQGSSGAGLTAATVPDEFGDGGMVLEAGVLVLASPDGYASIDELPLMRADDMKKMTGAMEQQIVKVDRAGIHATMKSQCSILAAGNPKEGRWDPEESITKQINLPPTIIGRFDLIFLRMDNYDEDNDRNIARRMVKAHRHPEEMKPIIDKLTLRKFIALARRTVKPIITDAVEDRLVNYYVEKRKASKDSTIKITARQMDGMIRLCTASAKMRLSNTIEEQDVDAVLKLMETSVQMTCTDENGNVDVDILTVGEGKAQRDKKINLKNQIRALAGGRQNVTVNVDALIEECERHGMDRETVLRELKALREIGQVWMTMDGTGVMLT